MTVDVSPVFPTVLIQSMKVMGMHMYALEGHPHTQQILSEKYTD